MTQCHVRHIRQNPNMPIGVLGKKTYPITLNPELKSSFRCNVKDPAAFLTSESNKNNCVPASVILKLHFLQYGSLYSSMSKSILRKRIGLLNFNHLLMSNVGGGIAGKDLQKFEKANDKFHPDLIKEYPFLNNFNGIAINLYRIAFNPSTSTYHLFPVLLSAKWRRQDVVPIDLLVDNSTIRSRPNLQTTNSISSKMNEACHVLVILNLSRLVLSFSNQKTRRSANKFIHTCRNCIRLLRDKSELEKHLKDCDEHGKGSIQRRKCNNKLVHRPFLKSKITGNQVKNKLRFKPANFYKEIPPLILGK